MQVSAILGPVVLEPRAGRFSLGQRQIAAEGTLIRVELREIVELWSKGKGFDIELGHYTENKRR